VVITSLQPPAPVAPAFESVFSAEEQRQGQVLLARSDAVRALATNQSDIQRLLSEAEAYRHGKISLAQAEAPGFAALQAQYTRFPLMVTERMYLAAIERALQNQTKVILPADHPDQVISIDLKKRDMSDLLNME
jgi:membrane protease subunit HflK